MLPQILPLSNIAVILTPPSLLGCKEIGYRVNLMGRLHMTVFIMLVYVNDLPFVPGPLRPGLPRSATRSCICPPEKLTSVGL